MRYVVSGTITRYVEAEGDTIAEAIERWKTMTGEGYPDGWEDTSEDPEQHGLILGACEGCSRPILEGEQHGSDEDGILTCHTCLEEWAEEVEARGEQEGGLTFGGPGPEPTCECGHPAADHDARDPLVPCRACRCSGFAPVLEVERG